MCLELACQSTLFWVFRCTLIASFPHSLRVTQPTIISQSTFSSRPLNQPSALPCPISYYMCLSSFRQFLVRRRSFFNLYSTHLKTAMLFSVYLSVLSIQDGSLIPGCFFLFFFLWKKSVSTTLSFQIYYLYLRLHLEIYLEKLHALFV